MTPAINSPLAVSSKTTLSGMALAASSLLVVVGLAIFMLLGVSLFDKSFGQKIFGGLLVAAFLIFLILKFFFPRSSSVLTTTQGRLTYAFNLLLWAAILITGFIQGMYAFLSLLFIAETGIFYTPTSLPDLICGLILALTCLGVFLFLIWRGQLLPLASSVLACCSFAAIVVSFWQFYHHYMI
jgi:hypothetical protein